VVVLVSGKKLPLWGCLSVMTAAFLVCILFGRWNLCRGDLTVTAVDVGQGQSLIVRTDDCTAVIDCGGSYLDESGEAVARTLHSAGILHVDMLIVTHFDADHVGGVPQLLQRVDVGCIMIPDYLSTYRDQLEAAAAAAHVPVTTVTGEALVEISSGWMRLMAAEAETKSNDAGLCILGQVEDFTFLVTGDRTASGELQLLTRWPIPQVDLLVAGHHGAADSTSNVLLQQVKPKTVLISVEADNAYGHPAPETLQRLENSGAKVLRTDELGTITITYETGRDTHGKKTG
jgi:competence protein ComEC